MCVCVCVCVLICGCVRLFAAVCRCCCCRCLVLFCRGCGLWMLLCLWVGCLDIVPILQFAFGTYGASQALGKQSSSRTTSSSMWNHGRHILVDNTNLIRNFGMEFMTAPNIQHVTQLVSPDWCMLYEFASCPMTHAARSTTRAFTTAGGTLQHCSNLSVAAFAVHPNVWAAWFCSQRPCWRVLSRICARQVCAALLSAGDITPTTARTWRSRLAIAQGVWSDTWLLVACVLRPVIRHAKPPWQPELTRVWRQ